MARQILCIAGPTASGKSARAVEEALKQNGEVISVDSRQVYRRLDIGTEKISVDEMGGVPHHLIDIRDANEIYSAGDFVVDATRLIKEISTRGKLPILAGGTHFYFDALLLGLPTSVVANPALREELEKLSTGELYARVRKADARRADELDPQNRRRLIRALEIIDSLGTVPPRGIVDIRCPQLLWTSDVHTEWIIIDPAREELKTRIEVRLQSALERGLVDEVRAARNYLAIHNFRGRENYGFADSRLNELGLEYKIIGEYLRGERNESSLLPTLSAKLWQYARRQKAWLRKLREENIISVAP